MISRQGSHLNMLRDVAAFDISFRQPGQSGFVEDVETGALEIEVIEIEVLEISVAGIAFGCANESSFATHATLPTRVILPRRTLYRFRNRVWLADS
jgi:hypothetical protein